MNIIRCLLGSAGLCAAGFAWAGELRLVAHDEGRVLPVFGVENHRVVARDGDKKVLLRRNTRYALEGDLVANAGQILWTPRYDIKTAAEDLQAHPPGTAAVGVVAIRHLAEMDGEKQRSDFLTQWPGGAPEGGLVLLGWLVNGRISQLAVEKVPSTKVVKFFIASHEFSLGPSETSGQGIMLLWTGGGFATPAPRFKDKRVQQVLPAIFLGDLSPLRKALSDGMKPSGKGMGGQTLLHFAAEAGQLDAVDLLIRLGASCNATTEFGSTPLHEAATKGRQAVVGRLLEEKIDVSALQGDGDTPLHLALRFGHVAIAEELVNRKASLKAVNSDLRTPYNMAIDGGHAGLAALMSARGAEANKDGEQSQRVLLTQAGRGNVSMVEFLVSQKISANAEYLGHRPLAEAAKAGDPRLIPALLAGGAGINDANLDGMTALMMACGSGKIEFARALLAAGADPNLRDKAGRTGLHYAAAVNAVGLVELLVARGADLEVRNTGQRTALEVALVAGAGGAAEVLDRAGGSLDLKSPEAPIMLESALKLDLAGVIRRALAQGWSADTVFQDEWPARLVAEASRATKCLELFKQAQPEIPADAPVLVRYGELDEKPRPVAIAVPPDPRDPDADFPASLVEIDVVIDGRGRVLFPVVKTASDWQLAYAAIQSLASWRFVPLTRQGKPVATRLRLPVEFAASADLAINWMNADVMPLPLKRITPEYPQELASNSRQGAVVLNFTVGLDGRVKDVRVFSTTNPAFNQPAIAAILQWVFKPGEVDGQPAPVRMRQEIIFNLQ